MKKAMGFLFLVALALIVAPPAHAQMLGDNGEVYNRDLPADQCPTYDSCSMAPGGGGDPNSGGIAGGMQSCTASRCVNCGIDETTQKASCFTAEGLNGSCKCTLTTNYYPESGHTRTTCTGEGTCTYRR